MKIISRKDTHQYIMYKQGQTSKMAASYKLDNIYINRQKMIEYIARAKGSTLTGVLQICMHTCTNTHTGRHLHMYLSGVFYCSTYCNNMLPPGVSLTEDADTPVVVGVSVTFILIIPGV